MITTATEFHLPSIPPGTGGGSIVDIREIGQKSGHDQHDREKTLVKSE